ncbi:uncharacterized protein LOC120635626 isoform X2 [Pararge aegeria]|uniref:uncharacterized protein LOC120635626 isoform X2 n=1 Tax=Pararge aegeria TaxID=116150 RepID=UPI0019D232C0|nr:uncharacterized protein LOC120635626 isoform X2 [Pararge aegeria]
MGMSKFLNLQQNTKMADGKKSIKNKLIKPFVALFRKNKKNKAKSQESNKENTNEVPLTNTAAEIKLNHVRYEESPFDNLLKNLEKLEIEKKARLEAESSDFINANCNDSISSLENEIEREKEFLDRFNEVDKKSRLDAANPGLNEHQNDSDYDNDAELLEKFHELVIEAKETTGTAEDDEDFNKFSSKVASEDSRASRIDSQSSEDSGFADKCSPESDEDKTGEEEKQKEAKLQIAYIKRGPIKNNRSITKQSSSSVQPYEISLNPDILSGGYVITNPEHSAAFLTQPPHELEPQGSEGIDFLIKSCFSQDQIDLCIHALEVDSQMKSNSILNPPPNIYLDQQLGLINENSDLDLNSLLTPPNSVNSCASNSPNHINMESPHKNIDALLGSPGLSLNGDYEEFREIMPLVASPFYPGLGEITPPETKSSQSHLNASPSYPRLGEITAPETKSSQSHLNASPFYPQSGEITPPDTTSPLPVYKILKHYKDRQRELEQQFLKMECCQTNLTPCKEIFRKKLQNLPEDDKKRLCCGVAKLELKYAYGILLHTLTDLSNSDQAEDFKEALLCLVCEKVLSEQKTLFVEEFGLSLLKYAVLRCYQRPVITRYLVQCVRAVTRSSAYERSNDTVFTEVDSNGDNLLIACVREGDKCANVLRELVRAEENDIPLFDVHHVNIDGCTALHACCAGHGVSTPRAHTLHVLLRHASADRYRKQKNPIGVR